MPQDPSPGNVALLIDADNAAPSSLDPALTILAELGTVNVRRIYGNWRKPALKTWADIAIRYALEPQQQFDLTKGKNATDMRMTIDAMDLLSRGRITGFGLMSSDSDFMPLATRIRQEGLPVYGFGAARTPEGFRAACTRFIEVEGLIGDAAPPPVVEDGEPPASEGDRVAAVVKLLGDALKSAKRDADGYASLSEVGQLAGNRSSFDVRSYGFAKLSDLVATLPQFRVERRSGRAFVKRVH